MSRYQQLLKQHRRNALFLTPQDFLQAAIEYFEWAEQNPLQEQKVHVNSVDKAIEVTHVALDKVRPFTKKALAMFLGMPTSRLDSYKQRQGEGWKEAVEIIEDIIYTQKFENAAAGLLNSNIIVRDLGLTEKQQVNAEVQTTEKSSVDDTKVANVLHPDASPEELDRIYAAGMEPPLYTPQQIQLGVPWVMPPLPQDA